MEQETVVIDLDQLAWESIKKAAMESNWIPPQYYMNDWVADVCEFLRHQGPNEHYYEHMFK